MSTKPPRRPSVPRLDPDTLSSSLGIRPSDVKAAVREERHKNEMPQEWIIVYVDGEDLCYARCISEDIVNVWLEGHNEFPAKVIGPIPAGSKVEDRA